LFYFGVIGVGFEQSFVNRHKYFMVLSGHYLNLMRKLTVFPNDLRSISLERKTQFLLLFHPLFPFET
jgi:hypothetical protein